MDLAVDQQRQALLEAHGTHAGQGQLFFKSSGQAIEFQGITHFVVPVMLEFKDQDAAMDTIELLLKQKVDPSKIKVVFMKYTRSVNDEFDHVLRGMEYLKVPIELKASIEFTPVFDILTAHGVSLTTMLADKTNYKEKLLTFPKGDPERDKCIDMRIAQGSAEEVNEILQNVFDALFPSKKTASK
jgi:hypothetical protein